MEAARYGVPFAMPEDGISIDSEGYVGGGILYLSQIKERGSTRSRFVVGDANPSCARIPGSVLRPDETSPHDA